MTTRNHRLAVATLVVAALFGTQGCVMGQDAHPVSSLTVDEAKGEAQSVEDDIAALIPPESVTHVEQASTGGLLSCAGESAYQWYGHTYVDLRAGVDVEAILDAVVDKWRHDKSISTSRRTTWSKLHVVELDGPHNSTYFINARHSSDQISITSFSQCFILPEGVDPGKDF